MVTDHGERKLWIQTFWIPLKNNFWHVMLGRREYIYSGFVCLFFLQKFHLIYEKKRWLRNITMVSNPSRKKTTLNSKLCKPYYHKRPIGMTWSVYVIQRWFTELVRHYHQPHSGNTCVDICTKVYYQSPLPWTISMSWGEDTNSQVCSLVGNQTFSDECHSYTRR